MVRSHEEDLELARRCAAGDPEAWDLFVREYRPVLYRAADALDRHGSAREVADSLYAELYGVRNSGGERQSLFRYFSGRSSLATWLRAVLAQRYVDRYRSQRRMGPLPDEPAAGESAAPELEPDPSRARYVTLLHNALTSAIAALAAKDRLRLALYYVQELTLAEAGRVMQEHEATVSRQLARTRRTIRGEVERWLGEDGGLSPAQVAECLASISADPGPLDLATLLRGRRAAEQARERSL